ncbi:MAG: glutathione S-transferase family protein [Pseudomonadota bacterium]
MAEYELYCFKESGNAYKAAIMLELTGCDWSARWVDFFNGETRSDVYRQNVNVMGEVPVLNHGDVHLTQTGVILNYLSEQTGQFGGEGAEENREILRWILFDNHKLTSFVATYRFLTNFMKDADPAVTEFLMGRMIGAFKVLNAHLDGRAFVAANRPTIADLSLCGYLFWPDEFGTSWGDYPHIGAWLERLSSLPRWVAPYDLMPGGPDSAR